MSPPVIKPIPKNAGWLAAYIVHKVRSGMPIGEKNKKVSLGYRPTSNQRTGGWSEQIVDLLRDYGVFKWFKNNNLWENQISSNHAHHIPEQNPHFSYNPTRILNKAIYAELYKAGNCIEMSSLAIIEFCKYIIQNSHDYKNFSVKLIECNNAGFDHVFSIITLNGTGWISDAWLELDCPLTEDGLALFKTRLLDEGYNDNNGCIQRFINAMLHNQYDGYVTFTIDSLAEAKKFIEFHAEHYAKALHQQVNSHLINENIKRITHTDGKPSALQLSDIYDLDALYDYCEKNELLSKLATSLLAIPQEKIQTLFARALLNNKTARTAVKIIQGLGSIIPFQSFFGETFCQMVSENLDADSFSAIVRALMMNTGYYNNSHYIHGLIQKMTTVVKSNRKLQEELLSRWEQGYQTKNDHSHLTLLIRAQITGLDLYAPYDRAYVTGLFMREIGYHDYITECWSSPDGRIKLVQYYYPGSDLHVDWFEKDGAPYQPNASDSFFHFCDNPHLLGQSSTSTIISENNFVQQYMENPHMLSILSKPSRTRRFFDLVQKNIFYNPSYAEKAKHAFQNHCNELFFRDNNLQNKKSYLSHVLSYIPSGSVKENLQNTVNVILDNITLNELFLKGTAGFWGALDYLHLEIITPKIRKDIVYTLLDYYSKTQNVNDKQNIYNFIVNHLDRCNACVDDPLPLCRILYKHNPTKNISLILNCTPSENWEKTLVALDILPDETKPLDKIPEHLNASNLMTILPALITNPGYNNNFPHANSLILKILRIVKSSQKLQLELSDKIEEFFIQAKDHTSNVLIQSRSKKADATLTQRLIYSAGLFLIYLLLGTPTGKLKSILHSTIKVLLDRITLNELFLESVPLFWETINCLDPQIINSKVNKDIFSSMLDYYLNTEDENIYQFIKTHLNQCYACVDDPLPFYWIMRKYNPQLSEFLSTAQLDKQPLSDEFKKRTVAFLTMMTDRDNIRTILNQIHIAYWAPLLAALNILPDEKTSFENVDVAEKNQHFANGIYASYYEHLSYTKKFEHFTGLSKPPILLEQIKSLCDSNANPDMCKKPLKALLVDHFSSVIAPKSTSIDEVTSAIIDASRKAHS